MSILVPFLFSARVLYYSVFCCLAACCISLYRASHRCSLSEICLTTERLSVVTKYRATKFRCCLTGVFSFSPRYCFTFSNIGVGDSFHCLPSKASTGTAGIMLGGLNLTTSLSKDAFILQAYFWRRKSDGLVVKAVVFFHRARIGESNPEMFHRWTSDLCIRQ